MHIKHEHLTENEPPRARGIVLASLLVLTAACGTSDSEYDVLDGGLSQEALSALLGFHPVMVTSGTCVSKGFRPIDNEDDCRIAGLSLIPDPVVPTPDAASATPRGCTITAEPLGDGNASLEPRFGSGSETELEEQQCSHQSPCICADELPDDDAITGTLAVCRNGLFTPDPKKYYTIRSPNGRYIRGTRSHNGTFDDAVVLTPIAGDANQPYEQPGRSVSFTGGNEYDHAQLHFRFSKSGQGVLADSTYHIRNRATGLDLRIDELQDTFRTSSGFGLGAGFASQASLHCRGSQVHMRLIRHNTMFQSYAPVDAGGLMGNHSRLHRVSYPLVYAEPTNPGFVSRKTGCVKKKRSCSSVFGPNYKQERRTLCGAFHQNHELTCQKALPVPVSMHVSQAWYIEEVEQFSRAVDFDPAPVSVDPIVSPSAVADSMATYGLTTAELYGNAVTDVIAWTALARINKKSGPAAAAVFSVGMNALIDFGLGLAPESDPMEQLVEEINFTISKLQSDIELRTTELIDNGLAQESTRKFWKHLEATTAQFLIDQIQEKENMLTNEEITIGELDILIESLRNAIKGNADAFEANFNGAFPTVESNPDVGDLRRVHFAMGLAKLAAMQEVNMRAESALLQAYWVDGYSCEDVIENAALGRRAGELRTKLANAQDELVRYGRSDPDRRISLSADEFEFDARNFSYPVKAQLEFLDEIVDDTLAKCGRLRDPNDSFREHFETNTLELPEL